MPVNIRTSLQKALQQLHTDRAKIDRQILAVGDALAALGGTARRAAARAVKRARKRKPMTAAMKKAVSIRMKKYWAGRRRASSN